VRICPSCRRTFEGKERFCTKDAAVLVEQEELDRLGQILGNYKLLSVMGRGGMGTVYRAEHVYIGKPFAVKILHNRYVRHDEAVERFLREARAASSINHPNIVDVTDFGKLPEGVVYFVMEHLEGRSLEDLLERDGPVQLHRAINIVNQMASALAAAHEKDIVHRDLKPENVMLIKRPGRREVVRTDGRDDHGKVRFVIEKEGDFDFVKLLDFGIAKVQGTNESARMTAANTIFGTPEYMSPEQARGLPVDHRADVYALGIMFYDMLTGKVPFSAEASVDVLHQQVNARPIPPSQVAPHAEITPAAERLILRSLEKDPAKRQQSMDELRADLMGCYGSVVYRRDAHLIPGAVTAGVVPRPRRLTEELDEWLSQHREQLTEAKEKLQEMASAAAAGGSTEFDWDELAATPGGEISIGDDGQPILVKKKKTEEQP
jgi:serine/threonine-protein kinase